MKKCFLKSSLKLPSCSFEPLPCILPLDPRLKSSAYLSPFPFPRRLWRAMRSYLSLISSKWYKLRVLSPPRTCQPLHHLCCPPVDAFEDIHLLLKLWGPELHTALKLRQQECWMQRGNHIFGVTGDVCDAPRWGFALLVAQAPCWLLLSLLLTSTTRSPSAGLLSSCSSPSSTCIQNYSIPDPEFGT